MEKKVPKVCEYCLNGSARYKMSKGVNHTIVVRCTDQETEILEGRAPVFKRTVRGGLVWLGNIVRKDKK